MKKINLLILACMLFLLVSCTYWDKAKAKIEKDYETGKKQVKDQEEEEEICIPEDEYDELISQECNQYQLTPGKITYFFEEEKQGLIDFLEYADEFIYCSFPSLEDIYIAETIINKNELDIKILFDKISSFDKISDQYIPKENSRFNSFLAENIDVKASDVRASFCATEDGVFFTSNNFKDEAITQSIVFFDDPLGTNQLGLIYKRQFEKWWGEG